MCVRVCAYECVLCLRVPDMCVRVRMCVCLCAECVSVSGHVCECVCVYKCVLCLRVPSV